MSWENLGPKREASRDKSEKRMLGFVPDSLNLPHLVLSCLGRGDKVAILSNLFSACLHFWECKRWGVQGFGLLVKASLEQGSKRKARRASDGKEAMRLPTPET